MLTIPCREISGEMDEPGKSGQPYKARGSGENGLPGELTLFRIAKA